MNSAPLLLTLALFGSLPNESEADSNDTHDSREMLESVVDSVEPLEPLTSIGMLKQRRDELQKLKLLRQDAEKHPERWPKHVLLRLKERLSSLGIEEYELSARCNALNDLAERSGQSVQGEWTPEITLDPEALATTAANALELSPAESLEMYSEVHALLDQLRVQDEIIQRFQAEVLPLSEEAFSSTVAALAEGKASPLEALEAADTAADRQEALLSARIEREQTLRQLSQLTGLALNRPTANNPRCG
jgi:hypothetical protein